MDTVTFSESYVVGDHIIADFQMTIGNNSANARIGIPDMDAYLLYADSVADSYKNFILQATRSV